MTNRINGDCKWCFDCTENGLKYHNNETNPRLTDYNTIKNSLDQNPIMNFNGIRDIQFLKVVAEKIIDLIKSDPTIVPFFILDYYLPSEKNKFTSLYCVENEANYNLHNDILKRLYQGSENDHSIEDKILDTNKILHLFKKYGITNLSKPILYDFNNGDYNPAYYADVHLIKFKKLKDNSIIRSFTNNESLVTDLTNYYNFSNYKLAEFIDEDLNSILEKYSAETIYGIKFNNLNKAFITYLSFFNSIVPDKIDNVEIAEYIYFPATSTYLNKEKNGKQEFINDWIGGLVLGFSEPTTLAFRNAIRHFVQYVVTLIYNQYQILSLEYEKELVQLHATRAANISILVDSFAHNVAAHSLMALSNYFANRKNELETKDISEGLEYYGSDKKFLAQSVICEISLKAEKEYKILTGLDYTKEQKTTISISDIIRLGEKKDNLLRKLFQLKQPNSIDKSLPVPIDDSVYNYINYLSGKSEFWSAVISGESFNNSISNLFDLIWGFVDNPLFVGTLAGSEKINKIKFVIDEMPFAFVDFSAINVNNLAGNYQFVKPLDNFEEIKSCLSAKEILLPGSNVGKQSVYTIFENCLRNIKHYNISNPEVDEVEFHINIKETTNNKKFIFEIYLSLTKYLNEKSSEDVIKEILAQIEKGTYDKENSQPIFGGTSQSILCTSHLVTGRFSDEINKKNGERYFNAINDGGFVKYTFNLWKGEKVKPLVENTIIEDDDNISRYKFMAVRSNMDIAQFRNNIQDAIRIIQTNKSDSEGVYKDWLSFWLPNTNFECSLNDTNPIILQFGNKTIQFNHGENSENNNLLFRNHGIFKREIENKWDELQYDVAEAMLTGVYIIDNRLFNVFSQKGESFQKTIEDELNLFVKEENPASLNCSNILAIDNENNTICDKINFLIIHLSFIESLNPEYKNDINNFIKKIQEATNNRDNFHLLITTGRGRTAWKESIKEEYGHFVKHRSVFSLQNAMIDGVIKDDDFNLKYNIIKVLFGS
ncbi:MAG TPA: hypothetical protein P5531_01615 [Bacteroidales bacterium]|nr:hypothetical protein [Bacteroidales bacterium]HSA42353.1 hypothetical protein [Bacteroidales bacterium]